MKRFITILFMGLFLALSSYAQETETVRPLTDTEVVRKVAIMDVEGKIFTNVEVSMKCVSPDYFLTDIYKVKVNIKDAEGKTLWKKTFKNVYLFVFSEGQVQVGKQNFNQLLIQKSSYTDDFLGKIREKEGIF